MTGFAIVERELVARIDALKGPEASKVFARFAAFKRDEVIAADRPAVPQVTTHVDGIEGAALDTVRPDGVIRFEFNRLEQVVAFIWETLFIESPVGPGKRPGAVPATHYIQEHAVFIDGVEAGRQPTLIPFTAVVVFANLTPYSRRIEKGLSLQAPSGVYEGVAALARRRFGKQAKIVYEWLEFPGQGPGGPASASHLRSRRAVDDRFPSITVTAR